MPGLPLADLDEPLVTREPIQHVEGEGHVVEVEVEHVVAAVPHPEEHRRQHVDVRHDDRPDRLRLGLPFLRRRLLPLDRNGERHRLVTGLLEGPEHPRVAPLQGLLDPLDLDRARPLARSGQWCPRDLGRSRLLERPRKRKQHLLQAAGDRLLAVEARPLVAPFGTEGGVDEHKLIFERQFRVRVVALPGDVGRRAHRAHRRSAGPRGELHTEGVPEQVDVALRLPLLPAEHRHRPHRAPPRLRGARHSLHHHGERILEDRHRLAGLHGGHEVAHLLGPQRRGLHREQHVERFDDRRGGVDLHHVVLLFQLLDERLPRPLLAARHVEAAVQIGVGGQHAQPPPLLLGGRADRPHELVLDRRAPVEERHHDLLQSAGESAAEEDLLVVAVGAANPRHHPLRFDAVLLTGQSGLLGLGLGRDHLHVDLAAPQTLDLPKGVEQVDPRLGVILRDGGTDVRLDVDRSRRV